MTEPVAALQSIFGGAWFGAAPQDVERILTWVVSWDFTVLWCGLTLLYFLYQLLRLARRALPIRRSLARVSKALEKVDSPAAFARVFESYQKAVIAQRSLQHAWKEFDESLIKPSGSGDPQVIRNTQEPGFFFNDATIVQPIVHNRFIDTVPSHLVGAGILGTFVGLAAGVGLASGTLGDPKASPAEVQHALSQLLNGASLAFLTSIFGLSSSLAFLFLERGLVGSVHHHLGHWVGKLEACVELVTSEKIALEQLAHERRQTKALESFNDSLVFALEKALDEKVAARLGPALDRVVEAVTALRVDRADSNVDAMRTLVEEFTRNLTQSTGQEMQQIAVTLQRLGERFQGLITAAEESQQRSRGMIDSAAQNVLDALVSGAGAVTGNLKASIEGLSATLRGASQDLAGQVRGAGSEIQASGQATAERIAGALGGFTDSVSKLERVSTTQSELAERIQELSNGLRGAGEAVLEAHRGFAASIEPSRAVTRSLESAGSRLADSLASTSRLVDEAATIGQSIQAQHEKIALVWQAYEERFLGVDQSLQIAFRQLEEGVGRYSEQIKTFHIDADKHMGQAVQTLASATKELSEAIEDLDGKLSSGHN